MPHDMFGEVASRRPSAGFRRPSVVVVSVAVHAVALVALLIVPLMASDVLPSPRRAVDYFLASDIVPVALPPVPHPAPPGHTPDAIAPATAHALRDAAPVQAPASIGPEDPSRAGIGVGSAGRPEPDVVEGLGSAGIGGTELPPPAQAATPLHWHSGIRAPQKLVDVSPTYPAAAREARVEGLVIIEATIDARGNVEAARILKSVPLLGQAALDAVRQWKYTPTLLNGVPVPIVMTVTVNFRLR